MEARISKILLKSFLSHIPLNLLLLLQFLLAIVIMDQERGRTNFPTKGRTCDEVRWFLIFLGLMLSSSAGAPDLGPSGRRSSGG